MTQFELWEDGFHYNTIEADSIEEALEVAKENVDGDNYAYDGASTTLWIDVKVVNVETEEESRDTVVCYAKEPKCVDGEHDWQSPWEIVGGIKDNPGVWGKGGGVIVNEVCMKCGCKKTTDTWAQRPDTGEQGLTSVSYEPNFYELEEEEEEEEEDQQHSLFESYE